MVDGGSAAELSDGVRGWLVFYTLATSGTVAIMLANPAGRLASGQPHRGGTGASTQVIYLLLARPAVAGIRRTAGAAGSTRRSPSRRSGRPSF